MRQTAVLVGPDNRPVSSSNPTRHGQALVSVRKAKPYPAHSTLPPRLYCPQRQAHAGRCGTWKGYLSIQTEAVSRISAISRICIAQFSMTFLLSVLGIRVIGVPTPGLEELAARSMRSRWVLDNNAETSCALPHSLLLNSNQIGERPNFLQAAKSRANSPPNSPLVRISMYRPVNSVVEVRCNPAVDTSPLSLNSLTMSSIRSE